MKSSIKSINEQCLIAIKEKTTAKDNKGKKYELTDEMISMAGHKLYRIRALKDFRQGWIKAGKLGGFVESENNLSQDGDCWVYDEACVYGNARVYDSAQVYDKAQVYGNAQVYDRAQVWGEAKVYGNAQVFERADIHGQAQVYDKAQAYGQLNLVSKMVLNGTSSVG